MRVCACICLCCVSVLSQAVVLVPNPPVPISVDNTASLPVDVAYSSGTFVATWTNSTPTVVYGRSTDNGSTWALGSIPSSPAIGSWIAANDNAFVIAWVDVAPGSTAGNILASVSYDLGETWSLPVTVLSGSTTNQITIAATSSGFLVTSWLTDGSIRSFFSADGVSWSSFSVIADGTQGGGAIVTPVSVGNGSSFLATWGSVNGTSFSSFSSDNGLNWSSLSSPGSVIGGMMIIPATIDNNYLVTWQDNIGNGYSSFSSNNGSSWGSIQPIISGLYAGYSAVRSLGTSSGYVVTAPFADGSGRISISSDNGATWAPFVPFTTGYPMQTNNIHEDIFAGLALGADGILTTWLDVNANALSAFIPFSSAPSAPASLNGASRTNLFAFQKQYYVDLTWAASRGEGVIGYNVYRNGTLIQFTNQTTYIDQQVDKHSSYTYAICAVDGSGHASSSISTVVQIP